jgi:addiction module RelE/StbE family toxin
MVVREIYYTSRFEKQFKKLPRVVQEKAVATEYRIRSNPLHPSLRLHKLSGKLEGLWSISITNSYRIIFESLEDGDLLFISIGLHSIYQ